MGRYDHEPNRINKEDSLEYRYGNNPKVKKEVSLEWRIAKGILIAFGIISVFAAIGNMIETYMMKKELERIMIRTDKQFNDMAQSMIKNLNRQR